MSTRATPKPLRINNTLIFYPEINANSPNNSIESIQVTIHEQKSESETHSLRYVMGQYHPKYTNYLRKSTSKASAMHKTINLYINANVEQTIEYMYFVGQFGYVARGEKLEAEFGYIAEISEYETELYYLHDSMQKYRFIHCNIESKCFKTLSVDEIRHITDNDSAKTEGWIAESDFNAIPCQIKPENGCHWALNWKTAREDYLLKKMNLDRLDLMSLADSRGELFRQTAKQCIVPPIRALRAKISTLYRGKMVESKCTLPLRVWEYFYRPTIEELFGVSDDEELYRNGNIIDIDLELIQFHLICEIIDLIKFYDQNAVAFKLNRSVTFGVDQSMTLEYVQQKLRENIDKHALQRYKTLKEKNKLLRLRKVRYMMTVAKVNWKINVLSGKCVFSANCYKTTFLSNGTTVTSGKI